MAHEDSPSPIIQAFTRAVRETLPATQAGKLSRYESRIKKTTSAQDSQRARHCAHWAIQTAGEKDLPHPEWRKIKETHEIWKDAWSGAKFGAEGFGAGRPAPVEDIEIEWVEDAVHVASLVGSALGWEHARWDELLEQLIAMEPAAQREP